MRLLVLTFVPFLAASAGAQPRADTRSICPVGAPLEEIECLVPAIERADAELNRVYRGAIEHVRASDAVVPSESWEDALRAAQRVWIEMRDADCSLMADCEYYMGTGAGAAGARCTLQYTLSRTRELRERYGATE